MLMLMLHAENYSTLMKLLMLGRSLPGKLGFGCMIAGMLLTFLHGKRGRRSKIGMTLLVIAAVLIVALTHIFPGTAPRILRGLVAAGTYLWLSYHLSKTL